MKIKIKRFDKTIPLPTYKSYGAVCVDLSSRIDVVVTKKSIGYIPLNVAIELPEGYWSLLVARSSTHKIGLMTANGVGILDSDYKGDNDEYIFAVYNFTESDVFIGRGTRIAQLMVLRFERMEFEEVERLKNKDRNGFGSTGNK